MNVAIDRIGEGVAVLIGCGDPSIRMTVPVRDLPKGCREGDILAVTLSRDDAATAAAKERVTGLIQRLSRKDS